MQPEQRTNLSPETRDAIGEVFHLYDPPLWLVTARVGNRRGGLIATAVTRASIVAELPRMLIAIAKHHCTWQLIESAGRFALHLLPSDDLETVWRFGLASGHRRDKFAGLVWSETPDGNPMHEGALSWLDCRVEQRMDIGDRAVYLGEVVGGAVSHRAPVLTVGILLRDSPPERKAELKRLYAQDQAIDAAAIRAWRGADQAS